MSKFPAPRPSLSSALALLVLLGPAALSLAAKEDQAAVDELKKTALKVFLDCDDCDLSYIRPRSPSSIRPRPARRARSTSSSAPRARAAAASNIR